MSSVPFAPPAAPQSPRARQFRFSKAQTKAVVKGYEAGTTMAALAKHYGVKRQSISELLKREGATIRRPRTMSQAEIDQAVRLYESGQASRYSESVTIWAGTTTLSTANSRSWALCFGVQMIISGTVLRDSVGYQRPSERLEVLPFSVDRADAYAAF